MINFDEGQFINYSPFMDHTFGVDSKNSSSKPRSLNLSAMSFCKSFMVLHFIFKAKIPLEFLYKE